MKILAIGAHPDDIEIFMAGFLFACKKLNHEVHVMIATNGALGGKKTSDLTKKRYHSQKAYIMKNSFKRDNKIIKKIKSNFRKYSLIKFVFNVHISRKQYIKMIKQKYISCLMKLSKKDIDQGVAEINVKYRKDLRFKDILNCFVYKA